MNCHKVRHFKKVFTHLVLINKSLIAFPYDIEAGVSLCSCESHAISTDSAEFRLS